MDRTASLRWRALWRKELPWQLLHPNGLFCMGGDAIFAEVATRHLLRKTIKVSPEGPPFRKTDVHQQDEAHTWRSAVVEHASAAAPPKNAGHNGGFIPFVSGANRQHERLLKKSAHCTALFSDCNAPFEAFAKNSLPSNNRVVSLSHCRLHLFARVETPCVHGAQVFDFV